MVFMVDSVALGQIYVQVLWFSPTVLFHQRSIFTHNPSSRTVTLGLTQTLTEKNTRNISPNGKDGWRVGLTTVQYSCADLLKSEIFNLLQLSGSVVGFFTVHIYICSSTVKVKLSQQLTTPSNEYTPFS